MAIQLLVTDRNLNVVGDPIVDWRSLDVTRSFNAPAAGTLELVAYPDILAQLQPGNRIIVIRDGQIWCAGPMEVPQEYTWGVGGASASSEPDPGIVKVSFADDLAYLAGYKTYPNPAAAATAQTVASYVRTAVNGETILRDLVNLNCGPGALTARKIAHLVLGAVASVGTTCNVTTRFEPLLDACRTVAIAAGGLGFRTAQVGTSIEYQVYGPRDLTATARFSRGLGNLRAVSYKQSAPTLTTALVAGSGDAESRIIAEVSDATATSTWWRIEDVVNQSDTGDASQLTQSGQVALAQGAAPVELATVTVDTPDLKAGRDFDLGDKVSVELATGTTVSDLVRSTQLQASPKDGEYVTSVVGSPDATTDPRWVTAVRDLSKRLARLERT
ncbi:siphovirus ReqiPepy6 Gp37-like family protein [Actinoallomurus purpureus]|uniref:siphovirus ReqiPepy6 Gp37-like family protein n=1 Tax=Actinoallomurus purpureus TaxID=478114 RepID=UPI0020931CEC|nr:siphovirus ReqiPepy6 Gp37-like family protein [Actinoallomurus purpureus]MCO6011407.1 siphovirus ReqiPepy6 Gp37-like family protein [Actinoallomurus purpureus]